MIETLLTLLCFAILVIYVKFQDGSISLDDFKNDNNYPKKRYKQRKHYLDDVDIPIADKPDFCREKYIDHLMSQKWMTLKQSRLMVDDFKCKQCSYPVTFETSHCHHITYSDLGNEKISQLATLCPQCHNKIHEFHGKNAGHYPLIKR